MSQQPTITIPASTADKLAALGRAMLDLAREMKEQTAAGRTVRSDLADIPDDQRWFWTPEWQAMEEEADDDIAAGRVHGPFSTVEDVAAFLNSQV